MADDLVVSIEHGLEDAVDAAILAIPEIPAVLKPLAVKLVNLAIPRLIDALVAKFSKPAATTATITAASTIVQSH